MRTDTIQCRGWAIRCGIMAFLAMIVQGQRLYSDEEFSADSRQSLLKAFVSYRLRQTCLLASYEAYHRIESVLQAENPEFASIATYYRGLVAVELRQFEEAQQFFQRCASTNGRDLEVQERAVLWKEALRTKKIPQRYRHEAKPWVDRVRLFVLEPVQSTPDPNSLRTIDEQYVALATLPLSDHDIPSPEYVPTHRVPVSQKQKNESDQVVYELYDPAVFSFSLLHHLHNLRREASGEIRVRRDLLLIWSNLLHGGQDHEALQNIENLEKSALNSRQHQKELLALKYAALARTGRESSAVEILAQLNALEWQTDDLWALRALSIDCRNPAAIQEIAFRAVRQEVGDDPLAPQWTRSLQRTDQGRIASRLEFYHEVGWLYLSRDRKSRGFSMTRPCSRNVLRADCVSDKVNQLLVRADPGETILAKCMKVETSMRSGDWELWQNDIPHLNLDDFPEMHAMLPLARIVAGRLRLGDGLENDTSLPNRETEEFSEKPALLLSGVGLDLEEPADVVKLAADEQPAIPVEEQINEGAGRLAIVTLSGVVLIVLLCLGWILAKRTLKKRRVRENSNAW